MFNGVIPNPTTVTSAAGAKMAREHGADVILGLGGGSSMDAAKAIAVEATHPGSAWDYLFYKEPAPDPVKVLPVIAISTTSGTGAYVNLLAKEAIHLVVVYLPKVLEDGSDLFAREKMAWADTLAGLCIASAGVTLPHGMGMAVGGMYPHVAHGESLARQSMVLPDYQGNPRVATYDEMLELVFEAYHQ